MAQESTEWEGGGEGAGDGGPGSALYIHRAIVWLSCSYKLYSASQDIEEFHRLKTHTTRYRSVCAKWKTRNSAQIQLCRGNNYVFIFFSLNKMAMIFCDF